MKHVSAGVIGMIFAATLARPLPAAAESHHATAMDDRWHGFVAPYLWGSGLEGSVGVNQVVSVPVDLSFGDALSNLDFAFLGHVEARRNRLGLGLDFAYLNLGAEVVGPVAGRAGLGADARSVTAEGVFAVRVVNDDAKGGFVDVVAGARFMGNRATLAVKKGGDEIAGSGKSLNWVDALAGARFRLPLGGKAGLYGQADLAGFGSDLTFNLVGGLDVPLAKSWKLGAGYRYMDVDYDKGQGAGRRIWKITYQGPYLFGAYTW